MPEEYGGLPHFAYRVAALGISLTAAQAEAFALYRDAIAGAAARFNLTAVRDPAEIERRHFLESLALGRRLADAGVLPEGGGRVIDIGSGAGFPGLPIKIAWPELEMTLLDSNEKRARFLREVIERLQIGGAYVLEGRAEDWGRVQGQRETYDLVLARAVAPLPVLLEYTLPFLRVGGRLAAPKGSAAPRELIEADGALRELGGELVASETFEPPEGPRQTLLVVRKAAPTPERYPRRAGIPGKRPLT